VKENFIAMFRVTTGTTWDMAAVKGVGGGCVVVLDGGSWLLRTDGKKKPKYQRGQKLVRTLDHV
jgi:hypothetical protein